MKDLTAEPADARFDDARARDRSTEAVAVRNALAAAHRLAVMEDLHEGSWNHFSARSPVDPALIYLTSGKNHWSRERASDLALAGPDETMIFGRCKADAYHIHYPIYAARRDVHAVFHAHPRFTTAACAVEDFQLEMSHQSAGHFFERVAYWSDYSGEVTAADRADGIAAALGEKDVLFMRGHGVTVAGTSIGDAFNNLYILERVCAVQFTIASARMQAIALPSIICRELAASPSLGEPDHFAKMMDVLDYQGSDYRQ